MCNVFSVEASYFDTSSPLVQPPYYANDYYRNSSPYYRYDDCPYWDTTCSNGYYNSQNPPYGSNENQCAFYQNGRCDGYNPGVQGGFGGFDTVPNRPDLVLQSVYQNAPDRHVIAQLCNRGSDMQRSARVRTVFTTDNATATKENTLWLSRGQCIDSPVYVTPSALGISFRGEYLVNVVIDAGNQVDELDESNNILTRTITIDTDRRSGRGFDYYYQR